MAQDPRYGLSGLLIAKSGQGEKLLHLLLAAAKGMEEVPGCLCYIVSTVAGKPEHIHVYEAWTDEAAHQASLELPQFKSLIEQAGPILSNMKSDPDLAIWGGKVSPLG